MWEFTLQWINAEYRKTWHKTKLRENRGLLAKQELLQSLNNDEEQMRKILEIVQDPSIIIQILSIYPKFFEDKYMIARVIPLDQIDEFINTTMLPVNEEIALSIVNANIPIKELGISKIDYNETWLLKDKLLTQGNVLLLPSEWKAKETTHMNKSDIYYPVVILNYKGDKLQSKYSSTNASYAVTSSQWSINLSVGGGRLKEENLYTALHDNSGKNIRPCIALSNQEINWFFTVNDRFELIKVG